MKRYKLLFVLLVFVIQVPVYSESVIINSGISTVDNGSTNINAGQNGNETQTTQQPQYVFINNYEPPSKAEKFINVIDKAGSAGQNILNTIQSFRR